MRYKQGELQRLIWKLAQIKNERATEPLLRAAGDENREVSNLAVQALVEMGDSVHALIKQKLRSTNDAARRGSWGYLVYQPEDAFSINLVGELLGQPVVGVSSGSFLMGSDKRKEPKASSDEFPQHAVTLPGYWIGRYPVTVIGWREFTQEIGYKPDERSLQDSDNHPVRYVNWNDALAYCNWLREKSGLPVTLPSAAEWEKAARGPEDGRIYPWGDEFDQNKCNTSESGIRNTTPVGKYSPAGDSPFGCADMTGNVWEWTRSMYEKYPYKPDDGREDLKGGVRREIRGGSWYFDRANARASYRNGYYPYERSDDRGFRLVVRPPSL